MIIEDLFLVPGINDGSDSLLYKKSILHRSEAPETGIPNWYTTTGWKEVHDLSFEKRVHLYNVWRSNALQTFERYLEVFLLNIKMEIDI